MKKLTKDQRQYRKRKKNRKGKLLSVNISQASYEKIMSQAEKEGVPGYVILNRMIWQGLRRKDGYVVNAYSKHLQKEADPEQKIHYKGSTGEKAIRWWISTTAWIKLDRHAKAGLQQSKSRVVESLVQNYKFLTDAQRQRNAAHEAKNRELYGWYYNRSSEADQQPKQRRKAWEIKGGMPCLRPGLTLEHLTEEELEEFADALGSFTDRGLAREQERQLRTGEDLPPLSDDYRQELIARYMDEHPDE